MPLAACKVPVKRWSALSLEQKAKLVRCNLRHARGAIAFVEQNRSKYDTRGLAAVARSVVRDHRRIVRKALANLRAIHEAMLPHSIRGIICYVWGSLCGQALAVVQCESGFDIYNQTGDYWGLFQFGTDARNDYGFAWDAWTQTRAAKALFDDRWWYPWECAGPGFLGYF